MSERGLPAVWLTPLLVRSDVVDALRAARAPTLAVGSPADPRWAEGIPESDDVELLELDGLDHSLQVEGDPLASLEVLRKVTSRIRAFLAALPYSPAVPRRSARASSCAASEPRARSAYCCERPVT